MEELSDFEPNKLSQETFASTLVLPFEEELEKSIDPVDANKSTVLDPSELDV
jgi:hypothetical protein